MNYESQEEYYHYECGEETAIEALDKKMKELGIITE